MPNFNALAVSSLYQGLYKILSDVKPEVEFVIKTGRQVVEKKQVDNTEDLNERLNELKLQYNDLGAQVGMLREQLEGMVSSDWWS